MASVIKPSERRTAERVDGNPSARIGVEGAGAFEVLVHDVSQTGVRFDTVAPLEVGSAVRVVLNVVGSKTARVAWKRQCSFGCEFETPLRHQDVLRAMVGTTVIQLIEPGMAESLSMRLVGPRSATALAAIMGALCWAWMR